MSLDIGEAFREGVSRTFARNGLLLAVAFVVVAVLTLVLRDTVIVRLAETFVELIQSASPEELGVTQAEYDRQLASAREFETTATESAPLALGLPLAVAAVGLFALALFAEAVSIIAVRVFASDVTGGVPSEMLTDNIVLATLNGFIGGVVVLGLIAVGLGLFVLPGIFFAVAFFFLRQEIAIENKNFVQAMADSWRLTKGHRLEVFALGLLVVVISQLEVVGGLLGNVVSPLIGALLAALFGGVLTVFGAAVVTRAYVQLKRDEPEPVTEDETPEDPYDAALGPDDIPE